MVSILKKKKNAPQIKEKDEKNALPEPVKDDQGDKGDNQGRPTDAEREMTLMEHMVELRDRLVRSAIALVLGTIVSFVFARKVFDLLIAPVKEKATIVALSPTDNILMYFKVALVLGAILSMPYLLYEFVQFIIPGLYENEKRYLYWLLPSATIAFAAGAVFAALVVVPFSVRYLSGFMSDVASPFYQIQSYIDFVTTLMLWIGITFEMPLVIYFLAKLGVVNYKKLASWRKYAIVAVAVLAAVITPTPDPVTMMLVMIPLILLYEIGVQLARIA